MAREIKCGGGSRNNRVDERRRPFSLHCPAPRQGLQQRLQEAGVAVQGRIQRPFLLLDCQPRQPQPLTAPPPSRLSAQKCTPTGPRLSFTHTSHLISLAECAWLLSLGSSQIPKELKMSVVCLVQGLECKGTFLEKTYAALRSIAVI